MRTLFGTSVLLLAAASLPAQSPLPGDVLLLQQPTGQNCPVSLSARHAEDGGLVDVKRSPASPKPSYALTFSPDPDHRIRKLTATFPGISGLQFQPADQGKAADVTETLTLSPWVGQDHNFHSVVYTDNLTGVQWIERDQITYADGTTWHSSATATCRVAPNGFLLVAGR